MSFIGELKRRNVFRVGLLYVIASWIILKVTDVGVSLLHIPGWVGKLILVLVTVGFPLIIIFSWAYEITPDGEGNKLGTFKKVLKYLQNGFDPD